MSDNLSRLLAKAAQDGGMPVRDALQVIGLGHDETDG